MVETTEEIANEPDQFTGPFYCEGCGGGRRSAEERRARRERAQAARELKSAARR